MVNVNDKKIFYSDNIFVNDDNSLLKFVVNDKYYWQAIKDKNISFVNSPIKILDISEGQKSKYGRDCAVVLPYLKEYTSLRNSILIESFDTVDGLKLMKELFEKLKYIHEHDLIHGDISSSNIMINDDKDVKFIDFENGIVDGMISFFNDWGCMTDNHENIVLFTKREDIYDMIELLSKFLCFGSFDQSLVTCQNGLKPLLLPKEIENILNHCLKSEENIPQGVYFTDIIDYLLAIGYESPMVKSLKK